jgi:uncharacterized repeat protein (TIGR03803 family)
MSIRKIRSRRSVTSMSHLCLPASASVLESLESRCLFAASPYTYEELANFFPAGLKNPIQSMVSDSQGDIFGIANGGANSDGAIWEWTKNAKSVTVVASFDGDNGASPSGGLFMDGSGDLFGTCVGGGANSDGTVWELPASTPNSIMLLGSFSSGTGSSPSGQIYVDGSGDVFGTTHGSPLGQAGSIWEYNATTTTITPLVLFTAGGIDGANPYGGLITNGNGTFYGTTFNGGTSDEGTVFSYTLGDGNVTTLASFDGSTNGGNPQGGLAMDVAGDLFGTSFGDINTPTTSNVWKLPANSGTIQTLGFFPRGKGIIFFGGQPNAPVTLDANGNLFGDSESSGATNQGEVFEVPAATSATPGALTPLHSFIFASAHDPASSLILDQFNDIFGTSQLGGTKDGGVFYELLAPGNIPSTHLAVTSQPITTLSNGDFPAPLTVTIEGARNKTAAFDDSTITLSLFKSNGTLNGTLSENAVNGIATFSNLSLGVAGKIRVEAADGALKPAFSKPITLPIVPEMSIAQEPADVDAGEKMDLPIAVDLFDQFDNLLLTNHTAMKLTVASGPTGGKPIGGVAVVKNGVATFKNAEFTKAGQYTLNVVDGKIPSLVLTTFNVNPGPATRMMLVSQPANTSQAAVFGLQVELFDKFKNVATNDDSSVTLSLKKHPNFATLSGTLTEPVISGLATFSDLSEDFAGVFVIQINDSNLARPIFTRAFKVAGAVILP